MAKRREPNAVERLKDRIKDRIDADKHRPAGLRWTFVGLANHIGITKGSLSDMLNGKNAQQGALARLDRIADYFGQTPTALIQRHDTAVIEVQPNEFRLLAYWRRFPTSVQARIMEMFDYFAGLPPEEQEARRLWHRFQLIRNPKARAAIDQAIDDALRGQRYGPAPDSVPAAPTASGETVRATPFQVREREEKKGQKT